MRSAATIAAFAGLANAAAYYPPADVSAVSSAPAPDVTEYSTLLVTVTSCAPEVSDCPADSTVVESSVVPLTTSTVYETKVYTISHCGPEVVDCPYASGGVETVYETIAVSTTVCPVTEEYPAPTTTAGEGEETYPPVSPPTKSAYPPTPEESKPVYPPAPEESKPVYPPAPEESKPVYPPAPEKSTAAYPPKPTGYPPVPTKPTEETCPTVSVKTIVYSTEVTTVVPTVITKYETATLEVPCPEATTPGKPSDVPVPPPHYPSGNGTIPAVPSGTAPVEASGAAGLSGSVLVAALAAVAAFAFA